MTLISLFVGGLVLIFFNGKGKDKTIGIKEALLIGGLIVGLDRKSATEFSFLLAVPTMLAATGYDIYKSWNVFDASNFKLLASGMLLSFIFAMISIKFLIGYVKTHDFKIFGVYRIGLATFYWLFVK